MSSWFDQLDIGSLLKDSGLNELVEEVGSVGICISSYINCNLTRIESR